MQISIRPQRLLIAAGLGALGAMFLGGRPVPPCLGPVGHPEALQACAAAWYASASPFERFLYDNPFLGTVGIGIVLAVLVLILTAGLDPIVGPPNGDPID